MLPLPGGNLARRTSISAKACSAVIPAPSCYSATTLCSHSSSGSEIFLAVCPVPQRVVIVRIARIKPRCTLGPIWMIDTRARRPNRRALENSAVFAIANKHTSQSGRTIRLRLDLITWQDPEFSILCPSKYCSDHAGRISQLAGATSWTNRRPAVWELRDNLVFALPHPLHAQGQRHHFAHARV